ncbi:MAG: TetR/AcrR family transcriptional regulator [Nitrospirota bacterium]
MNRARTSAPQQHQPPPTSSHERQANLLSVATSLFAANGFTGTTTKQIAKATGISEALLCIHFPTKHALYNAIFAEKTQYSDFRETGDGFARQSPDS